MALHDWLQVGKGLSKDEKAQKLALQHWLEAVSFSIDISFSPFVSLSSKRFSIVDLRFLVTMFAD